MEPSCCGNRSRWANRLQASTKWCAPQRNYPLEGLHDSEGWLDAGLDARQRSRACSPPDGRNAHPSSAQACSEPRHHLGQVRSGVWYVLGIRPVHGKARAKLAVRPALVVLGVVEVAHRLMRVCKLSQEGQTLAAPVSRRSGRTGRAVGARSRGVSRPGFHGDRFGWFPLFNQSGSSGTLAS